MDAGVFIAAGGLALTVLGFFLRMNAKQIGAVTRQIDRLDGQLSETAKLLHGHMAHVPQEYATKKELNDGFDRIFTQLDRHGDKLDRVLERLTK